MNKDILIENGYEAFYEIYYVSLIQNIRDL